MFEKLKNKIKSLVGTDDLFSSISILPFSKYKKDFSKTDFLNAYGISLYVNKAVGKRAEKVGEVEFKLKRGDADVKQHEILDLLAKPNKSFTGKEFWTLYQKYMDIFGEVYILLNAELRLGGKTKVEEMHLLRSDMVKPFFDEKTGELLKIEHQTKSGTETIDGKEIIYAHNPDPECPIRGESLLRSGIRQIETATQIDEYHSKILENGGRVEGVFNFKTGSLTRKQLTELKEQYQEEYGNASKAGLPLFLAGDATYERLGLNPSELAYLETKKVTLNDITILTGVPNALLGVTSDETFSNADASIRIFLREVVKPLITSLVTKLNQDLVEDGLELTFIDPTPEDKEDKRKDVESGIKNYYMTPNEARKMVGLDPVKNGDDLLVPFNLMPLGQEKSEPKKGIENKDVKIFHPLQERENRIIYHALCVKRLDRRQKKMESAMKEYFDGQKMRLIEKLDVQKHFKKKDLLGEIFVESLEIKLAKETALPILAQLLKESAEDAKEVAGSEWEFNETSEIASWLDKRTSIFAEQINKTTFKKLKEEFQESLDKGENRKELVERIKNTYGDISKNRAAVIARTETHGVMQYGTKQGYKQAAMPIKIWVWAPGTKGGVRDDHQSMDGEEKPIDSHFSNGLDYPGDYSGGADEVINCQCFI